MADEGVVLGTTKRTQGQRPGEKAIVGYTGSAQDGTMLITYMDTIDNYFVDPVTHSTAADSQYFTNVYQVSQPYGRVYLHIYRAASGPMSGSTVKVNALIIGNT